MKNLLILLILTCAISAQAQGWKEAKQTKWKKTAICVGSSLLSIGLEMSGDALYDMGKASGNKSQMQWGHTLQATGYVVPLISIPFLLKDSDNKVISDVAIIVGTYASMRYATADLAYNLTAGLDPLYAGVTTEHDNIMSKMIPSGRAFTKTIALTFGISINLNYW